MSSSQSEQLHELCGFLHDPKTHVRAIAAKNLIPYSRIENGAREIFSYNNFTPVKDLQKLCFDDISISTSAITILVNLTKSDDFRELLLDQESRFLENLIETIVNVDFPAADIACILLCNLAKSDEIARVLVASTVCSENVSSSQRAVDQLLDCFVKGSNKSLNKNANFDILINLFADLTRFQKTRTYFLQEQNYDHVVPISKLIVFLDSSAVRRTGVAATIRYGPETVTFASAFAPIVPAVRNCRFYFCICFNLYFLAIDDSPLMIAKKYLL